MGTMAGDDDDPNRLWCVCRRPAGEDKFMICCDCYHEWYHDECVDISVSQEDVMSKDNEKYVYPLCLQSSSDQFIQWPFPNQPPASFQQGHRKRSGWSGFGRTTIYQG